MFRRAGHRGTSRRAQGGATEWVPSTTTIPGLVLYLDNNLITQAAGRGSAWPDQSGAGNHFTQANPALQPLYTALDATFPTAQPSLKIDSSTRRLVGPVLTNIVWIAAVTAYPLATFSRDATLMSSTVLANGYPIWGVSGSNVWRDTLIPADTNTRYRDGTASNVFIAGANTPHLYELVLGTPWTSPGNVQIGTDVANLQWEGSMAMFLAATSVPSAATRASLLAAVRGRGMVA
jgi:hypothetical protein